MATVVDQDGVGYVFAQDASGAFGILPGHADFITVLSISVISWRNAGGEMQHCAVRTGVLMTHDGSQVRVATREAVMEDSLHRLGRAVLVRMREEARIQEESRVSMTRLQLAAIRQLQRYLDAGRGARHPARAAGAGALVLED
jgi:F-type H+-transporting ATPase subunit epsilon